MTTTKYKLAVKTRVTVICLRRKNTPAILITGVKVYVADAGIVKTLQF